MTPKLTKKELDKLIKQATETRQFAFTHRSLHNIGASVLTEEGEVFGGCNIESVISGLGTCAERCAIDNAVSHGYYHFKAICTLDKGFTPTCGACLQYILLFSQLSDKDIIIVNADTEGNYEIDSVNKLLPEGYKTQHNLEVIRAYGKNGKLIRGQKKKIKKYK